MTKYKSWCSREWKSFMMVQYAQYSEAVYEVIISSFLKNLWKITSFKEKSNNLNWIFLIKKKTRNQISVIDFKLQKAFLWKTEFNRKKFSFCLSEIWKLIQVDNELQENKNSFLFSFFFLLKSFVLLFWIFEFNDPVRMLLRILRKNWRKYYIFCVDLIFTFLNKE